MKDLTIRITFYQVLAMLGTEFLEQNKHNLKFNLPDIYQEKMTRTAFAIRVIFFLSQ
jgi:hypothetical protein